MKIYQTPVISVLRKKYVLIFAALLCLKYSNSQTYGWSELGTGKGAFNANGYIQAICTNASGNVYAVGGFDDTSNYESRYVAHWNGSNWSELGSLRAGLIPCVSTDANGNVYTATGNFIDWDYAFRIYKWTNNDWVLLEGLEYSGLVNAICTDTKGNLYVAGLALIGGPPLNQYGNVEKWNDSGWVEIDSAKFLSGAVNTICTDSSGNLYAAGQFTDTSGSEYVAKWNGNSWSELGTGASGLNVDSAILSICADSIGNIYAAGSFKDTNGYYYVAKWNGGSWNELGNLQANGAINSICRDAAGNIYAAGQFTHFGYNYVAKWNGNSWNELGVGFGALNANGSINSICASPSGSIYAGGTFTDSTGYECVAKYGNLEPTGIFEAESVQEINFSFAPNPVANVLAAYVSILSKNTTAIITATDGRTIQSVAIKQNHFEIDVSTLAAGIYFITLQNENDRVVRRFAKE